MFKLMGKETNPILGAQTILIWTYVHIFSEEKKKEMINDLKSFKSLGPCWGALRDFLN